MFVASKILTPSGRVSEDVAFAGQLGLRSGALVMGFMPLQKETGESLLALPLSHMKIREEGAIYKAEQTPVPQAH